MKKTPPQNPELTLQLLRGSYFALQGNFVIFIPTKQQKKILFLDILKLPS